MAAARVDVRKARVPTEVFASDGPAEICPMAIRLQHDEVQPLTVSGAVVVEEWVRRGLPADGRVSQPRLQAHLEVSGSHPESRLEQRRLDFLSVPRALSREQSRCHRPGQTQAGHVVAHSGLTQGRHHPGARPECRVVERRPVSLRPPRPVACQAGIDEPPVEGAEPRRVEAEARQHCGAEVSDENVRPRHQSPGQPAPFLVPQVDGNGTFPSVVELEGRVECQVERHEACR